MDYQKLYPETDRKIVSYDLSKHNWPEYWLKIAKDKFPQIESLETVHKVLSASEINTLGKHCQSFCGTDEFANRVDNYFEDIVSNHIGFKEWMIQRYFTIRIVIPNQASKGRLLAFHQGIWVGNGLGLRTIWTPFTKVYDTNSMFVASYEDSVKITQDTFTNKWDYDTIQDNCGKYSKPIKLKPGETYLFQQQHIHGNFNNETDITRWSMDGRILPKGGHYHRKLPGGYFRFLGERESSIKVDTNKLWVSYAGWNTKFSNEIPLPMQRATINQYCSKYGIEINDYQFENEYCDWQPGLEKYITGLGIQGIVLCSIYCLPDDKKRRRELLQLAIDNNVELHFANELTFVRESKDIDKIKSIFEYINENTDPNITSSYSI
jgi:sporadic carbohydrate cluster 2OG-Fe(II) oxygenase/sporadic carbohydrate cluster protein (TIGR04323 family)